MISIDKAVKLGKAAKAQKFIKEARSKIKQRNKLIKNTDTSSVKDYKLMDDASDSDDDDKRVRGAEERAKGSKKCDSKPKV